MELYWHIGDTTTRLGRVSPRNVMGEKATKEMRTRVEGGTVLAQDEASSVVWGMPGFVAKAGLAHEVLPLTQMGTEIVRRVARGRSSPGFARRASENLKTNR